MFNATKVVKTNVALMFDRVLRNAAANISGVITSLSLSQWSEKVRDVISVAWFLVSWRETKGA